LSVLSLAMLLKTLSMLLLISRSSFVLIRLRLYSSDKMLYWVFFAFDLRLTCVYFSLMNEVLSMLTRFE